MARAAATGAGAHALTLGDGVLRRGADVVEADREVDVGVGQHRDPRERAGAAAGDRAAILVRLPRRVEGVVAYHQVEELGSGAGAVVHLRPMEGWRPDSAPRGKASRVRGRQWRTSPTDVKRISFGVPTGS